MKQVQSEFWIVRIFIGIVRIQESNFIQGILKASRHVLNS